MRSEKEIKERIDDFRATVAKGHLPEQMISKYNLIIAHLEWVLSEPKEAPLTVIELKELRAILAERRKQPGFAGGVAQINDPREAIPTRCDRSQEN